MANYSSEYSNRLLELAKWKYEVEQNVVKLLETEPENEIIIGNMVYSVMQWGDIKVPCYAYLGDIQGKKFAYYPIWDREETYEFGWSDFADCCRIYDVITKKIVNGE